MKSLMTSALSLAITGSVLGGCSSWPEHGLGGDAQVDTSHVYYLDQVNALVGESPETKGALETQWSLHNLKLDTLVLRGAQYCLPARVREVALMSQRTRRELDGNLLEDARNSLIVFQKETDELERRLIYVKRHTECSLQVVSEQQDFSHYHELRQRYYQLRLKTLLNDPLGFAFDSDVVARHYREKLTLAARYLKQSPELYLIINGHADAIGKYDYNQDLSLRRAKAVQRILNDAGIDADRMRIRAFGEQLPIDTNTTPDGRYMNRQVHVEFYDHHEQSFDDLFFDLDQVFEAPQAEHSSRVQYLKQWRKAVPYER